MSVSKSSRKVKITVELTERQARLILERGIHQALAGSDYTGEDAILVRGFRSLERALERALSKDKDP